ncbi:MAG: metal ABC transporter substrate-binding protein [Candidatus Competibacterales bacterium]
MVSSRRVFFATGAALLGVSLGLAGPWALADPGTKPTVVAVNYPLFYFAQRLVASEAHVVLPVPTDRDPAFWRPSIADISAIQRADLIVLNGAGFAQWTQKASLPRSRLVDTTRGFADRLIATETITHSHGDDGEHSHTGTAAFTWLDQAQASRQARAIAEALKRRRIGTATAIDARLAALVQDLDALDQAAKALGDLAQGRVLIASHPRYQYFARAYGVTIEAVAWDPGEVPSSAQRAELAALAQRTGATLFIWEEAPPAEAIRAVEALGLGSVVVPTLSHGPSQGDYLSVMATAIDGLRAALSDEGA